MATFCWIGVKYKTLSGFKGFVELDKGYLDWDFMLYLLSDFTWLLQRVDLVDGVIGLWIIGSRKPLLGVLAIGCGFACYCWLLLSNHSYYDFLRNLWKVGVYKEKYAA